MPEYRPITTLAELDASDDDECVQGYRDGRADPHEPGNNRSRSYWHGWRCAQMDAGRMAIPPSHRILTAAWLQRERAAREGGDE